VTQVKCLITATLAFEFLGFLFGVLATANRIFYLLQESKYQSVFSGDRPWPPPYLPQFGSIANPLTNSRIFYATALLVMILQLVSYYSVSDTSAVAPHDATCAIGTLYRHTRSTVVAPADRPLVARIKRSLRICRLRLTVAPRVHPCANNVTDRLKAHVRHARHLNVGVLAFASYSSADGGQLVLIRHPRQSAVLWQQ
jgi:hypothetical protein